MTPSSRSIPRHEFHVAMAQYQEVLNESPSDLIKAAEAEAALLEMQKRVFVAASILFLALMIIPATMIPPSSGTCIGTLCGTFVVSMAFAAAAYYMHKKKERALEEKESTTVDGLTFAKFALRDGECMAYPDSRLKYVHYSKTNNEVHTSTKLFCDMTLTYLNFDALLSKIVELRKERGLT